MPGVDAQLQREGDALQETFQELLDRTAANERFISREWYAAEIRRLNDMSAGSRGRPLGKGETIRRWWIKCHGELEEVVIKCAEYKAEYANCVHALLKFQRRCRIAGYSKEESYRRQEEKMIKIQRQTKGMIREIKDTMIEAKRKLREIRPWIFGE
ncbi:hypothetical protein TWF481_000542 [Arthrobotrys musiformis]|uniref:Uncharacterized protein n=1 Tax=Arthrobotrys musiformis TaxID=47236 RepID=A0AAV9WPQ8_9PEZI